MQVQLTRLPTTNTTKEEGYMIYMMYGNTVKLLRYKVMWEETMPGFDKDGKPLENTVAQEEWCISEEHRDEIIQKLGDTPYTVETIGQIGNEWINGMEFVDASQVPEALAMGEAAWWRSLNDNDTNLQFFKYLTDLDFRVLLLEWGVV